jgi:hypothetical protein
MSFRVGDVVILKHNDVNNMDLKGLQSYGIDYGKEYVIEKLDDGYIQLQGTHIPLRLERFGLVADISPPPNLGYCSDRDNIIAADFIFRSKS